MGNGYQRGIFLSDQDRAYKGWGLVGAEREGLKKMVGVEVGRGRGDGVTFTSTPGHIHTSMGSKRERKGNGMNEMRVMGKKDDKLRRRGEEWREEGR